MSDQNQTVRATAPQILDVSYAPAAGAVPIETFTLSDLIRRRPRAELASHQRLRFELIVWCSEGSGRHEVDFEPIDLEPGQILHVRSGQVSRWMLDEPYEAQLIPFRPIGWPTSPGRGARVLDPEKGRDEHLRRAIDFLAPTHPPSLSPRSLEAVRELVIDLLSLDRPPRAAESQHETIFREFQQLLSTTEQPLRTVNECARILGCSTRTLSRACNDIAGAAPKTLLDEAIAIEAQRRLSVNAGSILDVGEALGFPEPSHFSRFFRRTTGQTPSAFVESLAPTTSA